MRQKDTRFKTLDPKRYKELINRLQSAFPHQKLSYDWDKAKERLAKLGYNVQALFGNETMAVYGREKKGTSKGEAIGQAGKNACGNKRADGVVYWTGRKFEVCN